MKRLLFILFLVLNFQLVAEGGGEVLGQLKRSGSFFLHVPNNWDVLTDEEKQALIFAAMQQGSSKVQKKKEYKRNAFKER